MDVSFVAGGQFSVRRKGYWYGTCEPWVDSGDADVVRCYHFVDRAHHTQDSVLRGRVLWCFAHAHP